MCGLDEMVRCWCKNTPLCAIMRLDDVSWRQKKLQSMAEKEESMGFEILLPFSCLVRVLHLGYII